MKIAKTLINPKGQYLVWKDCHGAVPANTTSGIIYEHSGSFVFSWVDKVTEDMGILPNDRPEIANYLLNCWKTSKAPKYPKELDDDAISFLEEDREKKVLQSIDYKVVRVEFGGVRINRPEL